MKKLSFFLMAMLMSIMSFATEVTISFANANQRLSQDGNSQVWANAGVTFTNAKSASTNAVVDNTNPIRCYANSKITVEAPGIITKLVFDCNNGSYATALKNSIGNEASVSNDIVTVTPTSASETYVIVKLTAQVRIDKLTVTYTESGVAETVVANPIFSLAGGEYEGAQNVKISCSTVDATIYYTTNGEVPSKSSNVYSDPITISESTTIKAYAVKNGLEDSEIVEAVYTITEGPDAIIDFTSNDAWKFPADYDKTEKTYSDGTYTVVVNAASNGHKYQDGKLLLGKQGAYLVLPAFSKPVEKIACPAVTGASGKVTWNVYNGDNAVSQEVTACNIDQSFKIDNPAANQVYTIKVTNGNNLQISHIKIYYGEAAAVAKPYINGDAEFIESTEVTISAEEGLKVYYTLDGTDPTNASTEYTAPFKLTATTTVKAVAYDGETASEVSSKTFKAITLLTCKDAAELALSVANNNDLVPNGPYAFRGFVTNIAYAYQPGGTMSVWMADTKNGGKVMQAYKFTPEDGNNPPVVGDYLQVVGELTKYNTTPESAAGAIVTKYPAPVVNHNITVSANPAEAGTVTGAGTYEEGKTATLTATPAEGYQFVNWTVGEEVVSTENPYTFAVTADVEVVANFKEAEPEYNIMDITMTNLVVEESGDLLVLTASDDSNTGLNVMLAINEDGSLAADSYMALVQGWNETELPIVEGKITKAYNEELATDVYSGLVVVEYMGGKLGLNLTMYAAPAAPAIDVVVDNATITVETEDDGLGGTYEVITVSANWQESVLVIEGIEKEFEGFIQIKEIFEVDGEEDWYIWMCMNGVVTTVDNVLTVTGEFKNNWTGDVYNVTISGALPVEEPEVITYELNGGEFPAVVVPTNEELWIAFMPYYQEYYDVVRAEQPIASVAVFLSAGMGDDATIFTSEDSDYKWLGDYIIKVTTEQSAALTTLANWKFNAQAFFNANQYTGWPKSADFTEAGKPEAWGAAYQAAHAVVLPTEPVDAPYTLPTPVKDGFTFVGWYDNAAGAGDAYTVIPAGWSGTLYAIWEVEGPGTALENIAVEGKAVKAIINGQLIIIKNGVQYNAQGQVVK